ncbi:P-loop containing nucleoside triphosphate hydrolase protein [Lipomyces orientalis]|uniref:P-loop containing nucleoside triphosphate hydrolase protein n=1 Tax=Lipomyces orientalis TaxID=1233043 RepID=A0ACC3TQL3_9ASCO
MSAKQSGSLLSVPTKRSNSMRPPSTIPLSSASSSRLNRASEAHPSMSRAPSPVFGSSAAPKLRRSTENQPPTAMKRKEPSLAAPPQVPSANNSSRPSSRSSNRGDLARPSTRTENLDAAANKETNIHVVVRCRGRNEREIKESSGVVTSVTSNKDITVQTGPLALSNKTYSFDHVFGPEADQAMVYEDVVAPILEEALAGYNCTVFAYGQTGTGKTYTMSGDVSDNYGTFANDAGVIPRALYKLFQALEVEQSEYSVKCSFIELYNEELRDLISKDDDRKVKIYEDTNKKGIIIQGMEESFIKDPGEGLKILQDGSHKRQVAATKCNDLSSRSHTVFTITIHVKEISSAGEEYLRIGKLNLVDLAGSENISRSGAENKRAREAGMINQSLLTLGRVINALVDRSSHIPYRESKLTRLLQDSLGGRTKTCIIATISPAKMNLEETISTLDYASRAKNIRNKPQLNQVMSKKTLIKEYILEIERLKADLSACRQKNGVYITAESYQDITAESESRRILVDEQKRKIEVMETQLKAAREQYELSVKSILETKKELEFTSKELADTQTALSVTEKELLNTKQSLQNETTLRHAYAATEQQLSQTAESLIFSVQQAASDIKDLDNTIERQTALGVTNRSIFEQSQKTVSDTSQQFVNRVTTYATSQNKYFDAASERLRTLLVTESSRLGGIYNLINERIARYDLQEGSLREMMGNSKTEMNQVLEDIKVLREDIKEKVGEGLSGLNNATEKISQELMNQIEAFQGHTSTSYNQLGRDLKCLFDDMQRHMNAQNSEIEKLHAALVNAAATASTEIEVRSKALWDSVEEDNKKAVEEGQALISQISSLISSMVDGQTHRLATRIQGVQKEMATSKTSLDTAGHEFVTGVSGWLNKQGEFQRSMMQNKERIKQTIVESYRAAEQKGEGLQESTRTIHSEAIKIVSSQKENLATQMQALDEFVTRARAQNESHHMDYGLAIRSIESELHEGLDGANKDIEESARGLHVYGDEAKILLETAVKDADVHSNASVKEFTALRDAVLKLQLREYVPSGHTPKKGKTYDVPTHLPKTIALEEVHLGNN